MRAAASTICAVLVALAMPAGAFAHAVVEQTQPPRAAAMKQAPKQVEVTFDEPVETSFGALRVFDVDGGRVDAGELLRPSSETIAMRLKGGLPDGAYTATYRVVSVDSHPVAGGFSFTVGNASGAPASAVGDLLDEISAGPVTEVAFGMARAIDYAAIALLAGGIAFVLLVWLPVRRRTAAPDSDYGPEWQRAAGSFRRRTVNLLVTAAAAGMLATAAGVVLQAATVTGDSFWSALDTGLLHDVLNTRFGEVWKLRFTAFGLLAALLLFLPPGRAARLGPLRIAAFTVALAYLVVSPALGGHAGAGDDATLLVPLDVVHVAAMSAWVGGVALLVFAVPAATRRLAAAERTRLLAALVTRFSTVALAAVAALLATGVLQSVLHLDSFSDLLDTAFGRAILFKSALFVALVALGAHNRRRSQPTLRRIAAEGGSPGTAGTALRRALRAEVVLMAAVLAVTAALVSYSPSAGAASGPFSGSTDLGPARMELTVDPARPGRNQIHVYLFDSRTGAQFGRVREFGLTATERDLGIGPIALDARKAGPGHYTVPRAELAPAGDWTLTARARTSDFEELRGGLEVPIR